MMVMMLALTLMLLPDAIKGVGRGCPGLPEIGKNMGRGGAAVSCQRLAEMRGGKWLS